MTNHSFFRRPVVFAVGLLVAAVSLTALAPSAGAANRRVDLTGSGPYGANDTGGVTITGTAAGRPFDGTYSGTLDALDGSLPEPGECEGAVAALRLDGSRSRYIELEATGQVCGRWTDATSRVTHVFTGRYAITASSSRRLVGTDGFYEVRLTDAGRASVFAIDT